MRTLFFFGFWFLITTCYGLKVIAYESPVIDASTYLEAESGHEDQVLQMNETEAFPLPVVSHLRAGTVKRHSLTNNVFSQPLFVIGDDAVSREWLKKHTTELQKLHAIGFVTNISSGKALNELNILANVPLQPVDVDELAHLLNVHHYPFVLEAGVIWQ